MANLPVVLHERQGYWSRHLRPRLHGLPVRWIESRSTADLEAALFGTACPIALIDLGYRPRAGLEDLDRAYRIAPDALLLAVDPQGLGGVAALARQLGATHVASGVTPPPMVAALLTRWVALARQRAEARGWSRESPPERVAEPWSWINPLLADPGQPLR